MVDEVDNLLSELIGEVGNTSISPSTMLSTKKPINTEVYRIPVEGRLIGGYFPGQYLNPTHVEGHFGEDRSAPKGTPIYPIGPGVVTEAGSNPKGGIYCKTSHENNKIVVYYAHMDSLAVRAGQMVGFETKLGTVGKTGNAESTSPHLHYTIKLNGSYVDPKSIIGRPIGSFSKAAQLVKEIEKLANQFNQLV
jgi:murein DD-endopeptidase MepM/ murein hydrolase activator NlpD